jgi:hypothetical protein
MPMKPSLTALAVPLAVGLVIGIGATNSANASLLCGVSSCTETITSVNAPTEISQTLILDLFPSIYGTLTSVDLSLGGNINTSGTIANNSASPQSYSLSVSEQLSYSGGVGAPSNFPSLNAGGSVGPFSGTLASGATDSFSGSASLGPTNSTITTLLNEWTGSGTFDVLLSSLTGISISGGGGNLSASQSSDAGGMITLTYNFGPTSTTPLPASLPLFASGLGALGLLGWRRKRKAQAAA